MTKICYLLLCHKNPDGVIEQIDYLVQSGGKVVYHLDKNSPKAAHEQLRDYFRDNENVETVQSVPAGWGDWSLVKATLRMVEKALDSFPDVTHFYYLSGDCMPVRSHRDLNDFLEANNVDIIETADFYKDGWIKTGPHLERVRFHHFFNERKRKWLFYRSYDLQRLLGVERKIPEGLEISIGSQWWCLRRKTLERIMIFLGMRKDVVRFFKRTWIPDEIFFQSLVATLVPKRERMSNPPTFLRFSDYGLPTVFYDDHFDFLISQDRFFARKISEHSVKLRQRLIRHFLGEESELEARGNGVETINFTTHAGRMGVRFGERIWERYSRVGENRRIFVIVSKKWHVGDRLGHALSGVTDVPYLGYVFNQEIDLQGDLGNFNVGVEKRLGQPAAFLQMLMSVRGHYQIIIGLDPARYDQLKDLKENCADIRIIELENELDEEYLDGHAERTGLMVARGSSVQRSTLQRAILESLRAEAHRLRELNFERYEKIRSWHNGKMRAETYGRVFERDSAEFLNLARHIEIRD